MQESRLNWVGQSPCRPPAFLSYSPSIAPSLRQYYSALRYRAGTLAASIPSTTVNAKRKPRPKRVQTQGAERHRRHPCLGVRPGIPPFPSPVLLSCLLTTFSHSGNDSVVVCIVITSSPCAVLMLILLRMLTTRFAPCELRASIWQLELLQIAFHRPPGPPSPRQVARGEQAVGFNEEPHSFNDSRPGDHPRCSSSVFSRRARPAPG